jgi:hypothetical protein
LNDKELLELAAKAAGYVEWDWLATDGNLNVYDKKGRQGAWNPLTDDGDALRLAVKLEQCVTIEGHGRTVAISVTGFECEEINRDNPYAATRRAIVRAAAEIGKNK